ncbi:hypothetical protein FALBO_12985 [Fusarium albosuccineum]|uniref:Uncharacterized protein n=1 Tax=Fusarium albosuccineum TaxID=1237068 RepID=A0A8H4L0U3_9HYPO|nr:hypothetical protein FALBO_12985 [Fusarium albosuccineum]
MSGAPLSPRQSLPPASTPVPTPTPAPGDEPHTPLAPHREDTRKRHRSLSPGVDVTQGPRKDTEDPGGESPEGSDPRDPHPDSWFFGEFRSESADASLGLPGPDACYSGIKDDDLKAPPSEKGDFPNEAAMIDGHTDDASERTPLYSPQQIPDWV